MIKNIYETTSLVEALKFEIDQKNLNLRRVCLGCDINASYFSRALKEEANLSSSQIFRILRFLNVPQEAFDYFLLLWHFNQAQEKSERDYFSKKIKEIQNEKSKMTQRLESKVVKSSEQIQKDIQNYYSESVTAMIHMLLTIDKYSKQPHLICNVLGISERKLNLELTKLSQLGMIDIKKESVKVKDENLHLPEESPLSFQNHINWRLEAVKKLNLRESEFSDYHFSAAFTCDEEAKLKIKNLIKDLIVSCQKTVTQSEPEKVSRLLFDLF